MKLTIHQSFDVSNKDQNASLNKNITVTFKNFLLEKNREIQWNINKKQKSRDMNYKIYKFNPRWDIHACNITGCNN